MIRKARVEGGLVKGIPAADPRITAFKGIPFAAPRWERTAGAPPSPSSPGKGN